MSITKSFIRKHWTGRSAGGIGDRDAGYPEPRVTLYTDLCRLAKDHGTRENEAYERVTETVQVMTAMEVDAIVKAGKDSLELERIRSERERDEAEFARLSRKLKKNT